MVLLKENEIKTKEVLNFKGVHLYSYQASLCSRKVRLFLALKNVQYTLHNVDIGPKAENHTPYFLGINPRGLVPVLIHNGNVHIESNDIMKYIDETFDGPKLMPHKYNDIINKSLDLEDELHLDIRTITMNNLPRQIQRIIAVSKYLKLTCNKLMNKTSKTIGGINENTINVGQNLSKQIDFWEQLSKQSFTKNEINQAKTRLFSAYDILEKRLVDNKAKNATKMYLLPNQTNTPTILDITWFIMLSRTLSVNQWDARLKQPNLSLWYNHLRSLPEFVKEDEYNRVANNATLLVTTLFAAVLSLLINILGDERTIIFIQKIFKLGSYLGKPLILCLLFGVLFVLLNQFWSIDIWSFGTRMVCVLIVYGLWPKIVKNQERHS